VDLSLSLQRKEDATEGRRLLFFSEILYDPRFVSPASSTASSFFFLFAFCFLSSSFAASQGVLVFPFFRRHSVQDCLSLSAQSRTFFLEKPFSLL